MESKICGKCGELRKNDEFSKKHTARDGLACICKKCHKKYRRDHYLRNKDTVLKQVNCYHEKHPKTSRRTMCDKKSGRKYTSECARCGTVIYLTKKEITDNKKRYCSRTCYNESKKRPFKRHVCQIKKSASKRGKEFDLSESFLKDLFDKQDGKCAITGVPLRIYGQSDKTQIIDAASLDRIDSSLGYIKNNVQWVLLGINYMKRNFSEIDLFKLLDKIVENYKQTGQHSLVR